MSLQALSHPHYVKRVSRLEHWFTKLITNDWVVMLGKVLKALVGASVQQGDGPTWGLF